VNPFEFAFGIFLVITVAGLLRMLISRRDRGDEAPCEADRLRDEVVTLRDRVAVLERITLEKENSLEREIEKLRDR
jgi:uncharacterized protein YlxW (UPF0749 family)